MLNAERERARIVVLEDELDCLKQMRTWLVGKYEVVCLSKSDEVLEELSDLQPDLLIVDVADGEKVGLGVCRHIRSKDRFAAMPMLLLTAGKQEDDLSLDPDFIGDGILSKPVNKKTLDSKIKQFIC